MREHGGNIDWACQTFGAHPQGWIDLSTGINRISYPLKELSPSSLASLPTQSALQTLLHYAQTAYRCDADIAALSGAQTAIQLLPHFLCGQDVRIFAPTYGEYHATFMRSQAMTTLTENPEQLAGADIAIIVNPNNPGGQIFDINTLKNLARKVDFLVVDESFNAFEFQNSLSPLLSQYNNILVLNSFGKFFGLAGLRLGFVMGASDKIDAVKNLAGPWPVSPLAIEVGTTALQDKDWIALTRKRLACEIARLDTIAKKAGWEFKGGTLLFRTYQCHNATTAQQSLAEQGIWTRIFSHDAQLIRLGLPGTEQEWQRLEQALHTDK